MSEVYLAFLTVWVIIGLAAAFLVMCQGIDDEWTPRQFMGGVLIAGCWPLVAALGLTAGVLYVALAIPYGLITNRWPNPRTLFTQKAKAAPVRDRYQVEAEQEVERILN